MTKHFFIIVPYIAVGGASGNKGASLTSFGGGDKVGENAQFESSRLQLDQRIATVMQGLTRFGLRGQKLGTEEVVELFYKLFNPGEGERAAPKLNNQ
jgi:hypothetical protein